MKRHPALAPLSREHHQGLVQARRLRRAAESEDPEKRLEAARAFCVFFASETLPHFREEEELVFPLLVREPEPPPEPLARALLEHTRIHALVGALARGVAAGEVTGETLGRLGELLHDHIRFEERELFPLVEELAPAEHLTALDLPDTFGRCMVGEPPPGEMRTAP